jgi:hypothetical protein
MLLNVQLLMTGECDKGHIGRHFLWKKSLLHHTAFLSGNNMHASYV